MWILRKSSTIDWDDLSLQFVDGPVEELLVDPSLYDCWADQISEGAEVLVTSHTLGFADSQVLSASGMTAEGKISLASPLANPMSGPDDFTVEVALLSRRIVLEASSDSSIGGHFIVLHTPDVIQTIRGVQIKGFGQQGNLGRYVSNLCICFNHLCVSSISLTHLGCPASWMCDTCSRSTSTCAITWTVLWCPITSFSTPTKGVL